MRGAEAAFPQPNRSVVEVIGRVDHGDHVPLRGEVIAVARHGVRRACVDLSGSEIQRPVTTDIQNEHGGALDRHEAVTRRVGVARIDQDVPHEDRPGARPGNPRPIDWNLNLL
jgi:hypothetical protein